MSITLQTLQELGEISVTTAKALVDGNRHAARTELEKLAKAGKIVKIKVGNKVTYTIAASEAPEAPAVTYDIRYDAEELEDVDNVVGVLRPRKGHGLSTLQQRLERVGIHMTKPQIAAASANAVRMEMAERLGKKRIRGRG